jgi:hypothetical protein
MWKHGRDLYQHYHWGCLVLPKAYHACFHLIHNHLSLSARAKHSRSRMPRPLRPLGAQVVGQLTKQCPLLNFSGSSSFHKKFLRILSICRINHFCTAKTARWYIGCEVSTLFTKFSRPAMDSSLPFHPGIRAPILSSRGYTSTCRSLRICSGRPKYFPGNFDMRPGMSLNVSSTSDSSHLIGKIFVLLRFTLRPEQSPKKFRTWVM